MAIRIEAKDDQTFAVSVDQTFTADELARFIRDLQHAAMVAQAHAGTPLPPVEGETGKSVSFLTPSRIAVAPDQEGNQTRLFLQFGRISLGYQISVLPKLAQAIVASLAK